MVQKPQEPDRAQPINGQRGDAAMPAAAQRLWVGISQSVRMVMPSKWLQRQGGHCREQLFRYAQTISTITDG
jgi:hypothetical protein